jgi:hypothetical protein
MSRKFRTKKINKYKSEYCNDRMSFEDCELAILRHAVDVSEEIKGFNITHSEEIIKIIKIVEDFIIKKKLICYGGTAINNILPKYAQFYNKDIEIPDYDFFSPNAMYDAMELANIYNSAGYTEVEAKAGIHFGTYKVYVNFIPIADITYLQPQLFKAINKESITISGIKYAPPNFLRMSMYLELSRPMGDTSRWEKILKRINLLNKYYPFGDKLKCTGVDFQREMSVDSNDNEILYITARDVLIEQGVIFFGGYASSLYARYIDTKKSTFNGGNSINKDSLLKNENMKGTTIRKFRMIPDFDVISEDAEKTSLILRERLISAGFKNVYEIYHKPIGELIADHYEICIGKDTIAYIFNTIACHGYNTITIKNKEINVASIDTILSFYLAYIYTEEFSFFKDRLLCMAKFLFEIEENNRLEQKGLLKRFTMSCIGKQPTLEDIRYERTNKFNELKKDTEEYNKWFLKYIPTKKKINQRNYNRKTRKTIVKSPEDSISKKDSKELIY